MITKELIGVLGERREPQTLVGRWLRAMALEQERLNHLLKEEIRRTGIDQMAPDQPGGVVLREAFTLMIRRRFSRETHRRVIVDWVDDVASVAKGLPVPPGVELVCDALGKEASTGTISGGVTVACRSLLFLRAFADLHRDPVRGSDVAALDEILVEAEARAREHGYQPLPAANATDAG